MKVRDVMTSRSLITARPEDELGLAAQMMVWGNARHLPVVEAGRLVGVVSQRDLIGQERRLSGSGAATTVGDVMHSPAVAVDADAALSSAVSLMLERKLGCLPVVSEGTLLGILTTTDLLRLQMRSAPAPRAGGAPRTVRAFMKPVPANTRSMTDLFDAAALMVRADAPITSVIEELVRQDVGVLPVVGEDGTLLGVLPYDEIIRALRAL